MFGDMMGKLQEMKQQVEEAKKRLNNITVKGEVEDGKISVIVTGNKEVKDIVIDDELMKEDKEELQDLLIIATNRALKEAEKVYDAEMQGTAKGILPGMNLPGM